MKKRLMIWLLGLGLLAMPPYGFFASEVRGDDIDEYGEETEETSPVIAADEYSFSLTLKVPQVLNNTSSLGERKFKTQHIKGKMYIVWHEDGTFSIEFSDLVNKNFKVRGVNVTYDAIPDESVFPRFNYIGNNKTGKFSTPCLCFAVVLEPSYALGGATEDNSFTLVLSGKGTSSFKKDQNRTVAKTFSGYAAGRQGCGCAAYGHKSPTRDATVCGPGERDNDVVATFGKWTATWKAGCYIGCYCR